MGLSASRTFNDIIAQLKVVRQALSMSECAFSYGCNGRALTNLRPTVLSRIWAGTNMLLFFASIRVERGFNCFEIFDALMQMLLYD
jgi:hypothetical protein